MRIRRYIAGFFQCVVLVLFLTACGGGGGSDPPPPAPSATTTDPNPISNDNAVLNGDVNPNGLATTAWFEYGQDNALSTFSKTADQAIGSGTGPVPVDETIFNLTAGTTYYFRVAARNGAGTTKGTIESFEAALLPPTVFTSAANPVSNDNAILNGDVNPRGLTTDAWFEWGTDRTLNGFTTTPRQSVGSATAPVPVDCTVLNLTPGTTYYFRVVAENSAGPPSKGTIENFTASQIPSVTTNAANPVTSTTATLNGSVNPNGLQTNHWFLWGEDPNLTNSALTHKTPTQVIQAGTFSTQAVSAPLAGLGVGTTYYFRVVAENTDGQSQGTIRSFTTFVPPTVNTAAATAITTTGALLNGDVNPNGYLTEAWFEWGTDPTLSSSTPTTHQSMGSGMLPLSFSASISGLTNWSTYYYRAAASNGGGTQRGVIRSFPTGEYYVAVGDSITRGSQDNIPGDDTSLDGRNTGGGFEPILNNLLTAAKGYPHTVVNAGVSGDTSANGAASISTTLSNNPSARYYLVLYGTNDAFIPAVSKAAYKANMQAIITAIKNAGKIPYLAKVPYTTDPSISNASIQGYNAAIDELRVSNGISVVAPDFYSWFQSHTSQLADGIHPDGVGYQSMGGSNPNPNSWFTALTQ